MKTAVSLLLAVNTAAALTVRVESPNGAPRLVVNGRPVRARMFWGHPGSTLIWVSNDWRQVNFEFVASETATTATMHVRFGHQQGAVELRDITVNDQPLREWIVWPPTSKDSLRQNNNPLQVTPPSSVNDFHLYCKPNLTLIAGHRYRVCFAARATHARPLNVAFYRPGRPFVRLGGPPDVFVTQIKLAAKAGVNFVSFPVNLPWPEPGQTADWKAVDAICQTALQANPRALLLPRIAMNPPPWWREANPGEVMQWDDGRRDCMVVASPRYRRDAAERLAALIEHLEEKFGKHVAGYHIAGQNTGEWFYEGTWKRPLSGYAPADRTAWQQWLRTRGRAELPVPTPEERRTTNVFATANVVDWAQFQQEAMADCVIALARTTRRASRGKKLVVFFYGYVFEFAPVANGPAVSGHYALRRVLNCPDID
ncbi:MAG: beta-galactosidase, partial [Verrucomicrobiae bacterium]|nr:beta-galactosidase [Verrucomicrobiae bacterium]